MKIGFTGTRSGMTEKQKGRFLYVMQRTSNATEFHHGDCKGADHEAALMARDIGIRLICHPPTRDEFRAHVVSEVTRDPLSYLERNMAIVRECDLLIAAPKEEWEIQRSGTWATVRYARDQKRNILFIWPDGTTDEEFFT